MLIKRGFCCNDFTGYLLNVIYLLYDKGTDQKCIQINLMIYKYTETSLGFTLIRYTIYKHKIEYSFLLT